MNGFQPIIQAIVVTFGDSLEQLRDPALVSCALVLVVVALGYLISPSVRLAIETTLAMKNPSGFKRMIGGLLILLPGLFILASTYFAEFSQAVEQRWPELAKQYIAPKETSNKELVAHRTTRPKTKNNAPVSDAQAELKRKQAARKALLERRFREQRRRKNRNANVWLTKKGELGAVAEEDLDRAVKFLRERKMAAFHGMEAEQRVLHFKEGERVRIEKYEYTTGKVRVRLLSSNMVLWTFRKSLTEATN